MSNARTRAFLLNRGASLETMTLAHLRHHAVARTLFAPTTLRKAVARLGFVQADPIRAPARAQDLVLRHRVKGYWPEGESPSTPHPPQPEDDAVRLLAPFDPIVWDRARFETLWGWVYRFEAYTPAPKRVRGYYALPLLWRDHVIGWGNVAVREGALDVDLGYVAGHAPRGQAFRRALEEELERMRGFLSLASVPSPAST